MLDLPVEAQPEYGRRLGDASYWSPYVAEVLARHDLPRAPLEVPFVGTFPTFLAGDLVVKLFGPGFDGGRSFEVERAMHTLLAEHIDIPAPGLVATGELFEEDWPWPYLVTERLGGTAVRDVPPDDDVLPTVARQLGVVVAGLHRLPAPAPVAARDPLADLRRDAPARLSRFGLPPHLVAQVPDFIDDAATERVLVHADLTADHVYVDGDGLVGVIDWGDALAADRWYDLPAVRFDGLRSDGRLFEAFLEGANWVQDGAFPRRALQGVLEFQFDAISAAARLVDLQRVRTLDELAELLFGGH